MSFVMSVEEREQFLAGLHVGVLSVAAAKGRGPLVVPVWYDYELAKGRNFVVQIDRELRAAKAVLVLWCGRSVDSEWVLEEVDLAKELGTLVPVRMEPCSVKAGYRLGQAVDLIQRPTHVGVLLGNV